MQKIKVSLVGYGYWGPKLARNFQNSNFFNITSIIDKSSNNLKKAKKDFPLAKVSKNFKDISKNRSVSLVVVATPTNSHFQIAKFALENKKNVLVEKPLSSSINEVIKLENISKKNKVLLFVDYPFLFSGSIEYLKKIIETKKYGNLIGIESFREQAPIRKDCNVIWDLVVHDISILNYILKKNPTNFSSVKFKTLNLPQIDTTYLNLTYPSKVHVFLKSTWISPQKIRLIKLKFKRAIVYCDENEPVYKIKIFKKKKLKSSKYSVEIPEVDLTEPLSVLVNYVHKSINSQTNNIYDKNFNLNITKILKKLS